MSSKEKNRESLENELEIIAKYNLEHGTHFYKIEQVRQHAAQNAKAFDGVVIPFSDLDQLKMMRNAQADAAKKYGDKDAYKTYVTKPALRDAEMLAGSAATIASIPAIGIGATVAGMGGGAVGGYLGEKAGNFIDEKLGTTWVSPTLSTIGGFAGFGAGMNGFNTGLLKLGTKGFNVGKLYDFGKINNSFKADVASNLLNSTIKQIKLPYAEVKYYGPTMGKTTAALTNKNLIDFDDISRNPLKAYANSLGMTKQDLMMSTDLDIVTGRTKLLEDILQQAQFNPANAGKTIVISKSDLSPMFGSDARIPSWKIFAKRNAQRGETDITNSLDWYNSQLKKNPNITIDDRFVSEIEADPHLRIKVGDVEINNPLLYYRQSEAGTSRNFIENGHQFTPLEIKTITEDRLGIKPATFKQKAGIDPGYPQKYPNAMYSQGKLWYGIDPNKPSLLVTSKPLSYANKNGGVESEWSPKIGTRRVTNSLSGELNPSNTTAYTYIPGYGYKKLSFGPKTSYKFLENPTTEFKSQENWQLPRGERNQPYKPSTWLQGDDAIKMFETYGGIDPVVEDSPLMKDIIKYVPEARERYGLVGNTNISDETIAKALYKRAFQLSGENNGAVNEFGEPMLLFRGDTERYSVLKPRMSPEELATKSGTMDNSLGTLFLDYPDHYQGLDRYLGTARYFNGDGTLVNSGTGSKVIGGERPMMTIDGIQQPPQGSRLLYSGTFGKRQMPISVFKLPASEMESGVNDINAAVVRTPNVRNASPEISVLNDDWLAQGAKGSKYYGKTKYIKDENGFPLYLHEDGTTTPALYGYDNRQGMAQHYRYILNDSQKNNQGLFLSEKGSPLREEHTDYNYYAVPNHNIRNVKYLLGYDLNYPLENSWSLYRKQGGILKRK